MATSKDDDIIRIGDLVVVVHWFPCGHHLGAMRTVEGFTTSLLVRGYCSKNGTCYHSIYPSPPLLEFVEEHPAFAPIMWCRKIKRVGDEEQSEELLRPLPLSLEEILESLDGHRL